MKEAYGYDYNKALEFAIKAHYGQVRKYTNEPYINHCKNVAAIVSYHTFNDPKMICAAVLHDVLEDTETTFEYLSKEFGIDVATLVMELTDVYTAKAYPNINRKERKLLECFRLSKVSGEAKTIKCADLIDNTESIVKYDKNFSKVYLAEKEDILAVFVDGVQHEILRDAHNVLFHAKHQLGLI